jgi:hypothetical protein
MGGGGLTRSREAATEDLRPRDCRDCLGGRNWTLQKAWAATEGCMGLGTVRCSAGPSMGCMGRAPAARRTDMASAN